MQFRCLLAGVALVLGGSLAACDGGDDSATPLTTTSSPAESTTTATTAPTTSTTLDFETEVKLAALELIAVRNEVLMAPDPARVRDYLTELCVCFEREINAVQSFADEGLRWATTPVEPLGIRVDRLDDAGASFTLVARQPPGQILGPGTTEEVREVDIAPYVVAITRVDAGWRINGLDALPMTRDAALTLINEEGLP